MRKWLTIKASVLSLAWLVIFLHDAIPHNHSSHPGASCHNIIHAADSQGNPAEDRELYSAAVSGTENGHAEGEGIVAHRSHHHHSSNVCHFSTNLFSKHSSVGINAIICESFIPLFSDNLVGSFNLPSVKGYSTAEPESIPQRGPPSLA